MISIQVLTLSSIYQASLGRIDTFKKKEVHDHDPSSYLVFIQDCWTPAMKQHVKFFRTIHCLQR